MLVFRTPHNVATALALLFLLASSTSARTSTSYPENARATRGNVPADPRGVSTIVSPNGVQVRYKQPGKEGVCETTPGVNSYSGYVDLDGDTHMFFWFFEARHDPSHAPLTLWLNGGPGSDSLIGLFTELGPCNVSSLTTHANPFSWTEESNMLFLSQPVGVGFSYQEEVVGTLNATGLPISSTDPEGRYSWADPSRTDTTNLAAIGTWEVLQALVQELPTIDKRVGSRWFNLWTESYGGRWGPAFFSYFSDQNTGIRNGTIKGVELNLGSLGIINGIISSSIQTPYYPEFAYNNTYGPEASVNETVYAFMKMNWELPGGCKDQITLCELVDRSTSNGKATCASAAKSCHIYVENPFYWATGRNAYDIRLESDNVDKYAELTEYLNLASTQEALGVRVNYTTPNNALISSAFGSTGDSVYPDVLIDLEDLLSEGVSIHLMYGDADYICNWFGGEAVSLQVDYEQAKEFRASRYAPFVVNGTEYGVTRQYGNFSFTRIYDAGHMVPRYQPEASLEHFRRVLNNLAVADGKEKVTPNYDTEGAAHATHTNDQATTSPYATV